MEQGIESGIDHALENISTQLYILSVVAGVILFIIGLYLILRNSEKKKQKTKMIGLISLGIGILAFFSGIFQIIIQ